MDGVKGPKKHTRSRRVLRRNGDHHREGVAAIGEDRRQHGGLSLAVSQQKRRIEIKANPSQQARNEGKQQRVHKGVAPTTAAHHLAHQHEGGVPKIPKRKLTKSKSKTNALLFGSLYGRTANPKAAFCFLLSLAIRPWSRTGSS